MCGLVGFIDSQKKISEEQNKNYILRMSDTLYNRGPDDSGVWSDVEKGIYLGFRRLAILDLSAAGHQPMVSKSSRYIIVFNGEIYNHQEIRKEIEKNVGNVFWKGHSDTETILCAFETWGVFDSVKKFIGMFAFAVIDKETNRLILGRDCAGEKPLYYGFQNDTFFFGSELKAFKPHPHFSKKIDRNSLSLYLKYSYVPAPYSIYEKISKLIPGTLLELNLKSFKIEHKTYWSSTEKANKLSLTENFDSPKEAIEKLDSLLRKSISDQMIADVPLGAFLSGGVDSSTVVSLMQAMSTQKVKTFTIGFYEKEYDESEHASAIAKHLGTDHTELFLTSDDVIQTIPKMPELYDEPFADSSQVPTYLLAKLARRDVTVSLSGDAGDELFGGYNRYQLGTTLWPKLEKIPAPIRKHLAPLIMGISPDSWNRFGNKFEGLIPTKYLQANLGNKIHKGAAVMGASSIEDLYLSLLKSWQNPEKIFSHKEILETYFESELKKLVNLTDLQKMMVSDFQGYMVDDILVKVDRATMGVSLESRVPFLDKRVIEFAWSLPSEFKLKDGQTKWILRQVLYQYVPKELIERPKKGFAMPIDKWLRGPLKEWANNLLCENRIKKDGYFNWLEVQKIWNEHLSGKKNYSVQLWSILMFQAWLERENY